MYGRSDEEWYQLVHAGLAFLLEQARLKRLTSYAELNAVLHRRTGLRGFDFSQADERAAMGSLLGQIVMRDRELHPQQMISALVVYLNANDAGTGFYQLAQQLGLLEQNPTPDTKLRFWIEQVRLLQERPR